MSSKHTIFLIVLDLLINLLIGVYYVNYPETFMGGQIVKCPIVCSPLIFILEVLLFYIYKRFYASDLHRYYKQFLEKPGVIKLVADGKKIKEQLAENKEEAKDRFQAGIKASRKRSAELAKKKDERLGQIKENLREL